MNSLNPRCTGNVTFDPRIPNAFLEWPGNLAGVVCKTPPFGRNHAPRFAKCCSSFQYNVMRMMPPGYPASGMSCVQFCQVSPDLVAPNPDNLHGWSDHFMCLAGGGREPSAREVVCDDLSKASVTTTPSYFMTATMPWKMTSWTTDGSGRGKEGTLSSGETGGSTVGVTDGGSSSAKTTDASTTDPAVVV